MRFSKKGSEQFSLRQVMEEDELIAADAKMAADAKKSEVVDDDYIDEDIPIKKASMNEHISVFKNAIKAVEMYFQDNSKTYPEVQQLCAKDRQNPKKSEHNPNGDKHSTEQPSKAKQNRVKMEQGLNKKMRKIAKGMQKKTKAFTIASETEPPRILDLCGSPGTNLAFALEINPNAHAVAFRLPPKQGGLTPIAAESETVETHMLDITMLATHMGLRPHQVPKSHPYADRFLHTWYLEYGRNFDLVLCDSLRLGTGKIFCRSREYRRLLLTQLALGLEHLRDGRTMIIMLHKLEELETIRLFLDFKEFAGRINIFKPRYVDARRSSFYMVASDIQATSRGAVEAVRGWKREWKVATLGSRKAWRNEHERLAEFGDFGLFGIQRVLHLEGPELLKVGGMIWDTQAAAMKRAPFMKD